MGYFSNFMAFHYVSFSLNPAQQGWIILGMLKKAPSGVPCLRSRSYFGGVGFAQAGRHFAVLTY